MAVVTTTLRWEPDFSAIIDSAQELVGELQDVGDPLANAMDSFVVDVQNGFDTVVAEGSELAGKVKDKVGAAVSGIASFLGETAAEGAKLAVNVFGDNLQNGLVALGVDPELATNVQRFSENIADMIAGPLTEGVTGKVGDLGGKLVEKISEGPIGVAVSGAMTLIGTAAGAAMDLAIAAAPVLLPALLIAAIGLAIVAVVNDPSLLGKAADIGIGLVRGLIDGVTGILGGAVSLAGRLVGAVVDAVGGVIAAATELPARASQIGIEIVKQLINGIVGLVGGAVSLGLQLVGAVVDAVGGVVRLALDLPQKAAEVGISIVTGIINGVIGLVGGAVGFAVQLGETIVDALVDLAAGAVTGVVDLAKKAFDVGVSIVGGIIDGLVSLPGKLANAIGDAFRQIDINIGPFHISGKNGVSIDLPTIDIGDFHSGGSKDGKTSTVTGRAGGGPIEAGVPYLVGEDGPELRVFAHSGGIVPLSRGSLGPSLTVSGGVHLHIDGASGDPYEMTRRIDDEWERQFGFRLSALGG